MVLQARKENKSAKKSEDEIFQSRTEIVVPNQTYELTVHMSLELLYPYISMLGKP